jgi:hypothetical protein
LLAPDANRLEVLLSGSIPFRVEDRFTLIRMNYEAETARNESKAPGIWQARRPPDIAPERSESL